jgi:flagellar M-ring protein FliF
MLKSHVAAAANIGGEDPESRVSVLIAPFEADAPVPIGPILPVPDYVLYIAAGVLVLLLVLAIVLMIVGRKRKKKQQLEEQRLLEEQQSQALTLEEAEAIAAATAAAAAAGGTGADIMEINTEKSMELRKNVRQFAQNNPEIAAQMIKTWLRGGEENG